MNGKTFPDPDVIHPVSGYENEIYVRPALNIPGVEVGEFTYIADSSFDRHVTHHYPWNGDRLIIGKFCQIAAGVEFMMNGANHRMNCVSTFPFYTLQGWDAETPDRSDMPYRGDTVIGNDVWIGQDALILPGVHIGSGAVIGARSVVASDVEPYTVAAGNPAKPVRRRFDAELTELLLEWSWWDRPVSEINSLIPLLTCSDTEAVRRKIKELLGHS